MMGRFDVVISNVKAPNGFRTVSVPIWSENRSRMTLFGIQYQPSSKQGPTVNVKAADHKNSTEVLQ